LELHSEQAKRLLLRIERLKNQSLSQSQPEFLKEMFAQVRSFFTAVGKPTLQVRAIPPHSPPQSIVMNQSMREAKEDMVSLADQQSLETQTVTEHFNALLADRESLRRRVQQLGESARDYAVLAQTAGEKVYAFQDSFTDLRKVDEERSTCYVSCQDGSVTLPLRSGINHAVNARIIEITSDPQWTIPGNVFVALPRTGAIDVEDGQIPAELKSHYFPASSDSHSDPNAILDGNPDTWYEHQMINMPLKDKLGDEKAKGRGFTFAGGEPIYYGNDGSGMGELELNSYARHNAPKSQDSLSTLARKHGQDGSQEDTLKLSMTMKLEQEQVVSWISLSPYFPEGSGTSLIVREIETSLDNVNYTSIFVDPGDRDRKFNADQHLIPAQVKDRSKLDEGASWVVPGKRALYIRFTLESLSHYDCLIGHPYVEKQTTVETQYSLASQWFGGKPKVSQDVYRERVETSSQVERSAFISALTQPDALGDVVISVAAGIGSLWSSSVGAIVGWITEGVVKLFTGSYEVVGERMIQGVDVYEGWRWVIGIKDFSVMGMDFQTSAEIVSQSQTFSTPISQVSLSVSEFIPESFWRDDVAKRNSFIEYFVSFNDDSTWHQISPAEHQPVGAYFPPKIISVSEEGITTEGKRYVRTERPVTRVRLKARFARPTNDTSAHLTPVLYDWTLKALPLEGEQA
jgi:hypothetical protein